jgi:c-di-GMP-binding flagellar brake protein YcgR
MSGGERKQAMADDVEGKESNAERREYFRVTDVLPITVKKVENMVGKKSRVLSGYISGLASLNLAEDLNDGIVNPKLVKMLCEMNSKLDLILEKLSANHEEPGPADAQEISLSASGVSFGTPNELSQGDLVEVKMLLPLHPPVWILLYGNVSRATMEENGEYKVGVLFTEIEDEVRDVLSYYTIKRQRELIMKQRRFDM